MNKVTGASQNRIKINNKVMHWSSTRSGIEGF